MKKTTIAAAASLAAVLAILALAAGRWALERVLEQDAQPTATSPSATSSSAATADDNPGFLYGRVTAEDGAIFQGRLRFGGDQEAFWTDPFNGFKDHNPWAAHVPAEQLLERRPIAIVGFEIAKRERAIDLGRPFMARFGDIMGMEARGRDVLVTLKSGSVVNVDRFDASDFDDGVRVWDGLRGVVDLPPRRIRNIEFLPTPPLDAVPERLHGTVRTSQGVDFTGFVLWDQRDCLGTDELDGRTADGEVSLRFDTIRSIARRSRDSSLVTLVDGREVELSGTRKVEGNRAVYVDDRRYGRVMISWNAFERVDLSPGGSGPAYDDFPPGRPLTGSVTTRAGRRLDGRLVYDLDESETTETLDAPFQGLDYNIPFGLIASITLPGREERGSRNVGREERGSRNVGREDRGSGNATVTFHDGEELQFELRGDLDEGNTGMLVFVDGLERPEFVPWTDVEQIDLERSTASTLP